MANISSVGQGKPVSELRPALVTRVSKGVGALSLGALVQIIGQLSLVPVALYFWGKVRYGEWILLTGLVSLLRLTDLGLQTFVVNRLCSSYARDDRDQMQAVLHSALRVQIPLALFALLTIAIVLTTFPLRQALALQTVAGVDLYIVAILLAAELLVNVPMGVVAGIYRATSRLSRAAVLGASQQFSVVVLTILLVTLRANFASVAAVRLGAVIVLSLCIVYDLHRLHPWLKLWPGRGSLRQGIWMIGPGLFFLMIPVADYLSTQFSLLLLQRSLAGGEVSRLATHRTVVNVAAMVSGLLTTAMWPEITALHARSQSQQLIKAHRTLVRLNLWLVAGVSLGMLPFISLIYSTWTGGRLSIDSWTLAFLLIRMLLWGIWSASMTMLCAINRQRSVACVLLGAATLTSVLSLWLIPRFGISGAALSQLLGDLAVCAWVIPLLASREIQDSVTGLLAAISSAFVSGVFVPIALGFIGWRLVQSEILRFIVVIPAVSCLALVLIWRQMVPYERTHLFSLVKGRLAH